MSYLMIVHPKLTAVTYPFLSDIAVTNLPHLAPMGRWQIELAHDREQDLMIWVMRGQGCLMLDGKQHSVGANNAIFIPAGTLWSLRLDRQCFGKCLFLPRQKVVPSHQLPFCLQITDGQQQAFLNATFARMYCEYREQKTHWQQAATSLAQVLMIELQRSIQLSGQLSRETASRRLCRAYCDRVTRLYSEGASMAYHATALGVTPSHLTRVCKSETGRTAACLLIERQLHAARSLLTHSDTPIQDIAAQLGFNSPAYFTRFISQHTGQSPSRLRKSARTLA